MVRVGRDWRRLHLSGCLLEGPGPVVALQSGSDSGGGEDSGGKEESAGCL